MSTLQLTTAYVVLTCCHEGCGITFGVPSWWETGRRNDHTSWACPNGHRQSFTGEADAQREKRLREHAEGRIETERNWRREAEKNLKSERRRTRAYRGVITKTKTRISNGVCPCCNRTFQNVARHMKTRHADYVEVQS